MSTLEKRVFHEVCDRCRKEFVTEVEVLEDEDAMIHATNLDGLRVSCLNWVEYKELCRDCSERFKTTFEKFMAFHE